MKIKAAMEQIEELEHDRLSLYNLISSGSKRADREEELRASIAFKTANLERATFSASSASIYKPNLTVKKLPSEDFESEQLFEVRFTFGGNDVLSATVGENLGFKQSDNIEAELFYTVSVDEENYSAYILHLKYLELKVVGESEKQRLDVNADFFYQHTPIISLDFSAKKSQNANIFNSENPGMMCLTPC